MAHPSHHVDFAWTEHGTLRAQCRACGDSIESNPVANEYHAVRAAQNKIRSEFWYPCPGDWGPFAPAMSAHMARRYREDC